MKKQYCKFQNTLYLPTPGIHASVCRNREAKFHNNLVCEKVCEGCPLKEPTAHYPGLDIFDIEEPPARDDKERDRLMETYCSKCRYFNAEHGMCEHCDAGHRTTIHEALKHKTLNCPLGLW